MLYEVVDATNIAHTRKSYLRNDGTCSAYSMGRRAVSGGKDFPRDDERSRIRSKVLEEVGEAVQEDERLLSGLGLVHLLVSKDWMHVDTFMERMDSRDVPMITKNIVKRMKPISWIGSQESMNKNATQYPGNSAPTARIKFPDFMQVIVYALAAGGNRVSKPNRLKHNTGTQTKSVKRNLRECQYK